MDSEPPVPDSTTATGPISNESASQQTAAAAIIVNLNDSMVSAAAVATTGKRQAFSNIRRQLAEADLASPGVQKMLLEELERAEAQCDVAEGFRERFHVADKDAAVLREQLKTNKALEVFFGLGVGIGSVMIGLAPYFWDQSAKGPLFVVLGAVLLLGSAIARILRP